MKIAERNRHAWLLGLIEKYDSVANLNEVLGRRRADVKLTIIKNKWKNKATKQTAVMTFNFARSIEAKLDLERGLLDRPYDPAKLLLDNAPRRNASKFTSQQKLSFGERLKSARLSKRLTQRQLASLSGVRQSIIAQSEIGRSCSTKWITSLARALDCDPSWLTLGTGKAPQKFVPTYQNRVAALLADKDAEDDAENMRNIVARAVGHGVKGHPFATMLKKDIHPTVDRLYHAGVVLTGIRKKNDLALLLGFNPATLNFWEKNGMSDKGIARASDTLGCSPAWLAEGVGEMCVGTKENPNRIYSGETTVTLPESFHALLSPSRKEIAQIVDKLSKSIAKALRDVVGDLLNHDSSLLDENQEDADTIPSSHADILPLGEEETRSYLVGGLSPEEAKLVEDYRKSPRNIRLESSLLLAMGAKKENAQQDFAEEVV
jgi:transcriptional regulator with XRE-family HTH domain